MVNTINFIFADICSSSEDWVLLPQLAESTYEYGLWAGENVIKASANFLQREIRVFISSEITSLLSYTPVSKSYVSPLLLGFYEPGYYKAIIEQHNTLPKMSSMTIHLVHLLGRKTKTGDKINF